MIVGEKADQVKHVSSNNINVAERYAELAKEHFIKIMRMGTNATKTISFRVPISTYTMYTVLPPEVKWAIRKTVIEMIEQLFDQVSRNVPFINININNNINIAKAESKSEVKINVDVSSVLSELEELKKLIYNWYRFNRIPKAAYDTASSKIKKVEQLIKRVN